METLETIVEFLQNYQEYSLAMIFGMLILCGFGLPIPEDITLIAAGMSRRVSYLKFLLLDGAAALISVPVWVGMGHYGAQNRDNLARWMSNGHNITLVVIGVVILAVVILVIRNRKKAKKEKQNEAQNAGEESTDAKKEA